MSIGLLILVIVAAVVILVLFNLFNKNAPNCVDKEHFKNEWQDVIVMSKDDKTITMSVVQADKLLDEALKCFGYSGSTMAERLVAAKKKLTDRDGVWQAHKMRNNIVHESNYDPTKKSIVTTLKAYSRALKDLGAI